MNDLRHKLIFTSWILILGVAFLGFASGEDSTDSNTVVAAPTVPLALKIQGVDADNRKVIVNRLGIITLLLGTNEDSGDVARQAGKSMYPFQGRPDFQLIVVVDLRDSIASWVPSIVYDHMRSDLDKEAIELKPYFLKNNNPNNPRESSHVIADFNGSIFPQLGWPSGSDDLRGILFGVDGREIKRWSKIHNMVELQNDVRLAIEALNAAKLGKKTPPNFAPPKALPVNSPKVNSSKTD